MAIRLILHRLLELDFLETDSVVKRSRDEYSNLGQDKLGTAHLSSVTQWASTMLGVGLPALRLEVTRYLEEGTIQVADSSGRGRGSARWVPDQTGLLRPDITKFVKDLIEERLALGQITVTPIIQDYLWTETTKSRMRMF